MLFYKSKRADRIETLRFKFEDLPIEKITEKQKEIIYNECKRRDKNFELKGIKGDTWSFNFDVDIIYYGDHLISMLETIEKLMDNKLIPKVSTEELKFGKCLIQDVLNKIEKIEKRLK